MGGKRQNKKQRRQIFLPVLLLLFCYTFPFFLCGSPSLPVDGEAALPADAAEEAAPSEKLIALTFDDGPHAVYTPRLLEGLARRGVHATFFLIGSQASAQPDLVQQMDLMGHQIGLHTYDHVLLTSLTPAEVTEQMERSRRTLSALLGHDDFFVRPPYGITNAAVRARISAPLVLWSVDPKDWEVQDADRVVRCVTSQAKDGDIILLHDIFPTSVDAALEIVDVLQGEGFRFVTVEELFVLRGIQPENGTTYSAAPRTRNTR